MQVTSHFFAASLKKTLFVDLFVELQTYLNDNSIENCISIQNLLSLHITLYYFQKELSEAELLKITEHINALRSGSKPKIVVDTYNFFKRKEQDYLCYLAPTGYSELEDINNKFRATFPNDVPDNTHSFVPHITLFKVNDYDIFSRYKKDILDIFEKNLNLIKNEDAFLDFNLYAVNSKFTPQIQIVIY